ncbi:MAG: DNA-processing protein DprA, partial [Chloroflexi bacterium]|nr:DNA-processing protein DprA [Chloroflexota bacterium]
KYSNTLKKNLKMQYAPPLLYVKGNTQLLNELSVAIVGSRKASETALRFTQNIARQCSKNYEVIVSGFAKGVDKTALDAALEVHGQSIIVLPQGVLTFASGFRKYYTHIVEGNLLVLSAYHPKAPWSIGLAMGRNVYIYGLAEKIYVAESDSKGGTWAGVVDGLRKQRKIYVRQAEPDEKNANVLLIEQGAIPVNMDGDPVEIERKAPKEQEQSGEFDRQLKQLLAGKTLSAKQIKEQLSLEIDTRQLSRLLSQKDFITT